MIACRCLPTSALLGGDRITEAWRHGAVRRANELKLQWHDATKCNKSIHQSINPSVNFQRKIDSIELQNSLRLTKEDQALTTKPCLQEFSDKPGGYWGYLSENSSLGPKVREHRFSHCTRAAQTRPTRPTRPTRLMSAPWSLLVLSQAAIVQWQPCKCRVNLFFQCFSNKLRVQSHVYESLSWRWKNQDSPNSQATSKRQGSGQFLPRLCAHERKALEVGCSGLGRGP